MDCKNMLFVANKPMHTSSNRFLNQLKRKYNMKKMGFSGTLDPFACGCLIIASGQYTKLFRFLQKTPKTYIATLMLGAYSPTLDIEKIEKIENTEKFDIKKIEDILNSFLGKQTQLPPKYSAKRINGIRAYKIEKEEGKSKNEKGRNENNNFFLDKEIEIEILDIKLIDYSHPFINFKTSVSEGTYIRSLGFDIAKKLGTYGALTYLERTNEGKFFYECEKKLDPYEYLWPKENEYFKNEELLLGKKLDINNFKIKEKGIYKIKTDNFLSIIEIGEKIKYLVNRIKLC